MTKTLREHIENLSFKEEDFFRDLNGESIWFISPHFSGAIYSISAYVRDLRKKLGGSKTDPSITIGLRSYHKYIGGSVGTSRLEIHLDDCEATINDHEEQRKKAEELWDSLSLGKKRELVQFAYDNGEEVSKEDLDGYKINVA